MRTVRSALLDAPREPLEAVQSEARPNLTFVVERPLAGRIRKLAGPSAALAPADASRKAGARSGPPGQGSFFRACLLLLLQEHPAHGYDLLERLETFGFDSGDSGWMYRTLRSYEREKLLESTWQISSSGPPRRVYSLTDAGRDLLDEWSSSLRASRRGLDEFLERHGRAVSQRPQPG